MVSISNVYRRVKSQEQGSSPLLTPPPPTHTPIKVVTPASSSSSFRHLSSQVNDTAIKNADMTCNSFQRSQFGRSAYTVAQVDRTLWYKWLSDRSQTDNSYSCHRWCWSVNEFSWMHGVLLRIVAHSVRVMVCLCVPLITVQETVPFTRRFGKWSAYIIS
jgi:hypothetical protein